MGRLSGVILSIICAGACIAGGFGAALIPGFDTWMPRIQVFAVAGVSAAVALTVLVPASVLYDRAVRRVARRIVENGSGHPLRGLLARGVAEPFESWVREMQDSDTALRNELRDLNVRCRIQQTESEQLSSVLHALRDAVIVTDRFDEIITVNQAAAEIFGLDDGGAVHRPIDAVIADQRLRDLIRELRESGSTDESRQVEIELEWGETHIAYQVMLSAIAGNSGEIAAVVTILHDLSREREVAQMKSDFVSKASHELRTPLSSIRAYVEMLVDGEATDEESRREFYTIIQNETGRLSRLIDNMLNISRIEAGIIQIEREHVDMRALMARAVDSLGPQAAEKEITLINRPSPVDLSVEGDPDMLYQVVLNLVSNAVKYTPAGGRVTLTADSDNLTRCVVITVADTGLGIPPDAIPRLFEKFFRIENFKRVAKGTGLGLNLCKHIVETVHHGQIGVESQLGMGSKFWFSIPMRFVGAAAA